MDDCNYCNECDSCKGPRGPRGFRGPRGYEWPYWLRRKTRNTGTEKAIKVNEDLKVLLETKEIKENKDRSA